MCVIMVYNKHLQNIECNVQEYHPSSLTNE